MKIDFDTLGDVQKRLEQVEAGRAIMPGIPMLARLDGRGFHSFTRGLDKPFDTSLATCLENVSKLVLEAFNADVVYTQSDEITLAWKNPDPEETKVVFGGKYQKLCSLLAARVSVDFNFEVGMRIPGKAHMRPTFDCRVWQVPTLEFAARNFLWREMDATKNSVSMAASAYFTHHELQGVGTNWRKQMLLEKKNIVWEDYPDRFKKGSYFAKRTVLRTLSEAELAAIPEAYRPHEPIVRRVIDELRIPPATKITNLEGVLFNGDEPIVEHAETEADT